MAKVRNMYIGGNQIKQPYLGSNPLKAVYLGSTMVWGDRNSKVWVLDRITQNTTTGIRITGISSSYITYTHTTSSTFTTANANSYPCIELTENKFISKIYLWPANLKDCPWLTCYIYEYANANLSLTSNTYIKKIVLSNQTKINSLTATDVGLSQYASATDTSTQLNYLNENDYVITINEPNFTFKIKTLKVYNSCSNLTIKLKKFIIEDPEISYTNDIQIPAPNPTTTSKSINVSSTYKTGKNGIFNFCVQLEVTNSDASTSHNLGIAVEIWNSSEETISTVWSKNHNISPGSKTITIGTDSSISTANTRKNLRLTTETTSNQIIYFILNLTPYDVEDREW